MRLGLVEDSREAAEDLQECGHSRVVEGHGWLSFVVTVIPGQPAGLNPESQDSGFALRAPRNAGNFFLSLRTKGSNPAFLPGEKQLDCFVASLLAMTG